MRTFSLLFTLIVCGNVITMSSSDWVQGGSPMCQLLSTGCNAVGHYNGIVFIYDYHTFCEYDTSTSQFSNVTWDSSPNYTSANTYGSGQLYSQTKADPHLLYTLHVPYDESATVVPLMVFDMDLKQSVRKFLMPTMHDMTGCIASSSEYLIVNGGTQYGD
eukprot:750175_1